MIENITDVEQIKLEIERRLSRLEDHKDNPGIRIDRHYALNGAFDTLTQLLEWIETKNDSFHKLLDIVEMCERKREDLIKIKE